FICAQHDAVGHPRDLCHMYPEGVLASTFLELSHKDDLIADFLYRDVEVFYTWQVFLQLIQLVVVRCKKRLRFEVPVIVQMLNNRPRYRHAIVRACTTTNFIHQDQASMTQ